MKTFTLYQLNEYIRRTVALNLPEAVWISCEIVQCQQSRGHFFLGLAEKGEDDQIVAQANAILWATAHRRLRRIRGRKIEQLLREGLEVLLRIKVDYHERYGFRMLVEDIDPAFTLGKLEQRRLAVLTSLETEGLLGKNGALPLPTVLQRIAVISSPQAAGYQDFQKQLSDNPYGYRFSHTLFPAAMQGGKTAEEVVLRLRQIAGRAARFDLVVIIRGGGARLDLMAFDDLDICRSVANCPLPVLTGIGHEIDDTVMDTVAFAALKTPTAVADFLIHHNAQFEGMLLAVARSIHQQSRAHFQEQHHQLDATERLLRLTAKHQCQQAGQRLDRWEHSLPMLSRRALQDAESRLGHVEQLIELIGPEASLRRGYSLLQADGQLIRSVEQLPPGSQFTIRLSDGEIEGQSL